MNRPSELIFTLRPTITIELPQLKKSHILNPSQIILKVGSKFHDIGSLCYSLRSDKHRKQGQPRGVVLSSFLKSRPKQILSLLMALNRLGVDGGMRSSTINGYANMVKIFVDFADTNGFENCLAGGDSSRQAYHAWAEESYERYYRQEFGKRAHNRRLDQIRELLEASTGIEDLRCSRRRLKVSKSANRFTEPLDPLDFARALALNKAIFDGICDLVLEKRHFPYKLVLPSALGWAENHLWLFPTQQWYLPPHLWGHERENRSNHYWAIDYANGRLATPDEISHRYAVSYPSEGRKVAKKLIARAHARIIAANDDARDRVRIMLGMIAHDAFLFLFFSNTGANEAVVREIETEGEIDTATLNQQYRSIKFRARSKQISLIVPASFMPDLRRFMELRRYLLGAKAFPYLFFTQGINNAKPPGQIGSGSLESLFRTLLRKIDPLLPRMASRRLRASLADWYQRNHDMSVTAKVLQNSEQTTQKYYDAGSTTDHHEELSLFLSSVAESAKRQRIIPNKVADARQLEEGGCCDNFGHPAALAKNLPVKPNCRDGQGCLFCKHRLLVACEDDARKVASAAFLMEQLILGPMHEEVLSPLIAKCDEDLEKIAAFGNCRAMVESVRKDVFGNGNLTPYFADKYQLFLELGMVV